jgi:hypothetical protein
MESRITGIQWAAIVILSVCVVLLTVAMVHGWQASTSYTCLECRAELRKERWFGVPRSRLLDNDCSRWYAKTHAVHQHEWCWCGGETTRFPFGGVMNSCGKQHPIWRMPPQVQLEFMQSARAPELDAFWQTMKTSPREEQKALVDKVFEGVIDRR